MSDIDTVVVDSLKALDPERPIREADMFADIGRPTRLTPSRRLVGPKSLSEAPSW